MDLPSAIIELITKQGVTAPVAALLFLGLYLYERRARSEDRKAFDAALKEANAENVATLKTLIPLAQKFTDTVGVFTPLALAQIQRRGE